MSLLNIELPTWIPVLFFVVLIGGSFAVGAWLQKGELPEED
jgi:hypothetical protein